MSCEKCYDRGYYIAETGGPQSQRALSLCECVRERCRCNGEFPYLYYQNHIAIQCECAHFRNKFAQVARAYQLANIPKKYQFKYLPDFKAEPNTPLENVKTIANYMIKDYLPSATRTGLFLCGGVGNGKTLLCCIILNELIFHYAISARYMNLSYQYFHRIRDTFTEGSETYGKAMSFMEDFVNQNLLLIDDMGVQRNTDWEMEMLYNLIDRRYQEERITLITTNQNLEQMKDLFDGRIFSRIKEMCTIVELQAGDYRESLATKTFTIKDDHEPLKRKKK